VWQVQSKRPSVNLLNPTCATAAFSALASRPHRSSRSQVETKTLYNRDSVPWSEYSAGFSTSWTMKHGARSDLPGLALKPGRKPSQDLGLCLRWSSGALL
jgi:hypothetical protein